MNRNAPRAIIHKQILDHAEANPDASMEAIADAVSGATTATVERVLEEYGDPGAESGADSATEAESSPIDPPNDDATESESTDAETPTNDAERPDAAASIAASSEGESDPGAAVPDGGATSGAPDAAVAGDATAEQPVAAEEGPNRDREEGSEPTLEFASLTEKQRETLRAIHEYPDATQADLADMLGVSSPTISQRVNSIDGFDWSNRHALVEPLFDSDGTVAAGEGARSADAAEPAANAASGDGRNGNENGAGTDDGRRDETGDATGSPADERRLSELVDRVDDLAAQLGTIERELEGLEGGDAAGGTESSVLGDPDLAHKIVHACMNSDRITEDEELRLLREVTASGAAVRPPADSSAPNSSDT